jgi:hypothetical protein
MRYEKVGLGENGFVVQGPSLNIVAHDVVEVKEMYDHEKDEKIELPDIGEDVGHPDRKPKSVHWNGGNPEVRDSGPVPPDPEEAHVRLLDIARNEWGLTDSEMKTLRSRNSLLFEYIKFNNYDAAKGQADLAVDDEEITAKQRDDVYDLLDGVK